MAVAMTNEYEHWRQRAAREPTHAVSHFNWGWWAARNGRYEEAAAAYEQALELNIAEPEEAMTNLAALYSDQLGRTDLATQWLERALAANANYYAAHFNRGHLAEQLGDRAGAVAGFERAAALRIEDGVPLGRLLEATQALANDDPRLERLRRLANGHEPDALFSLARIDEQLGNYEAAWQSFNAANQADQRERPPWPVDAVQARYQSLMAQPLVPLRGDGGPVFIVGMFRTGSTLLEQMLAGHPDFTPLGESNFWPRQVRHTGGTMALPGRLQDVDQAATLASAFEAHLSLLGVAGERVTDKRPDNLYHLPLIAQCLPAARFVITERDWRDTLVSVFGTRLHPQHGYASDLHAIRTQLQSCEELAKHWAAQSPDRVYRLRYESLLSGPEEQLTALLSWLGAEWHEACLQFHERDNAVRTASVWQVRQPLHRNRMGRWQRYERFLRPVLGNALDQI